MPAANNERAWRESGLRDIGMNLYTYWAAGVHHQVFEHLVFVAGQIRRRAVDLDGLCGGVEHDRAALERGLGPAAGAAHQLIQAREQFLDMEWFYQVIVRALLEARYLVLP